MLSIEVLPMQYCARCRIGVLDEQGACTLCGAPATPPTRRQRLAEAGGSALAALLSPAVLGGTLLALLLLSVALATQEGTRIPAGMPRVGYANPAAALALARTDPGGAIFQLLLPALVQAVVFALILLLTIWLLRRLRSSQESSGGGLRYDSGQ